MRALLGTWPRGLGLIVPKAPDRGHGGKEPPNTLIRGPEDGRGGGIKKGGGGLK